MWAEKDAWRGMSACGSWLAQTWWIFAQDWWEFQSSESIHSLLSERSTWNRKRGRKGNDNLASLRHSGPGSLAHCLPYKTLLFEDFFCRSQLSICWVSRHTVSESSSIKTSEVVVFAKWSALLLEPASPVQRVLYKVVQNCTQIGCYIVARHGTNVTIMNCNTTILLLEMLWGLVTLVWFFRLIWFRNGKPIYSYYWVMIPKKFSELMIPRNG